MLPRAPPIEAGLNAIRSLRTQLVNPAALGLDDSAATKSISVSASRNAIIRTL